MKPIQVPKGGGWRVNVLGVPLLIRIHGRDPGGVVSAVESHDAPGAGRCRTFMSAEEGNQTGRIWRMWVSK